MIFNSQQLNLLEMNINSNLYAQNNLEYVLQRFKFGTYIDIIDVSKQQTDYVSLQKYFNWYIKTGKDINKRKEIWNLLSFEFSSEKLSTDVSIPNVVKLFDMEQYWSLSSQEYPKMKMYFLVSCANSFTDWHIDFTGTSVFYHILRGIKWFFLVEPTSINLKYFYEWSMLELSAIMWFPEYVRRRLAQEYPNLLQDFQVYVVELKQAQTAILPGLWIHCVYTPVDSQAYGGNILNTCNVKNQLHCFIFEEMSFIDKKYKAGNFWEIHLCWLNRIIHDMGMFHNSSLVNKFFFGFLHSHLYIENNYKIISNQEAEIIACFIYIIFKLKSVGYNDDIFGDEKRLNPMMNSCQYILDKCAQVSGSWKRCYQHRLNKGKLNNSSLLSIEEANIDICIEILQQKQMKSIEFINYVPRLRENLKQLLQ